MMGMGPGPGGGPGFGGGPGGFGPGGPGGPHGFGPGPMGPGMRGPMGPGRMGPGMGPMGPGMYSPRMYSPGMYRPGMGMMPPPMRGNTPVSYTGGAYSSDTEDPEYIVVYEEDEYGNIHKHLYFGEPKRRSFFKRFYTRIKLRLKNLFS